MSAADRTIDFGERKLTLRFSMLAFEALERHYGVNSIEEVGERLSDMKSIGSKDIAAIFHALTRTWHPDLTEAEIMTLLDNAGLDRAGEILTDAISAGSPKRDDGAPPRAAETESGQA